MKPNGIALAVVMLTMSMTPDAALAAVADSSAGGFTVKTTITVQVPPDEVYRRFVHNIGDWWDARHTFSGNPRNLSIDDKPGGCFCEKLPEGGVRHMDVIYVFPGRRIVLSGALGPLQTMAVTGSMTIVFLKADSGTKIDVTYAVSGYSPAGLRALAPVVDGVITSQFTRLRNYVEHGDPAK